jgi:cystinosin
MYAVEPIRQQYRDLHHGEDNLVALNDVIFAVNAFFVTSVMLIQIGLYRKPNEIPSKLGLGSTVAIMLLMGVGLGLAIGNVWTWLFFIYLLSYIKLVMTVVKYIPQVYLNYQRKSTVGWNVYNVILDFIGGLFSTAQLLLDAIIANHLAGIGGFMIKLGLGIVSIFFDVIFLLQHFVWFRHSHAKDRIVVKANSEGAEENSNNPKEMENGQVGVDGANDGGPGIETASLPDRAVTADLVR